MLNEMSKIPTQSGKSRLEGKHNSNQSIQYSIIPLFLSSIAVLLFASVASNAQGMMGGSMQHISQRDPDLAGQNMQQMNDMQNMQSMSDMMQHMQAMTHELSGMMDQMNGMSAEGVSASGGKRMYNMKGMDQQMSMMQQMQKLGRNMESLIDQMSKTMEDKAMMGDPKMKDQMIQMQKHMGSLVNDYHGMMENLKKKNENK